MRNGKDAAMSMGMIAVGAITAVGAVASASAQGRASRDASNAQVQAAQIGADGERYRFDELSKLMAPYHEQGPQALQQQQNLIGMNGGGAQQSAIDNLRNQPGFQSLVQSGENAILQNASATGGLRGGNTQAALAQFAPQMLSQAINDQYARLGGMVTLGQNSAAGVGNAGMQTGQNIAQLQQQAGAAQAGGLLAGGRAQAGMYNSMAQGLGTFAGMGGFNGFGGGASVAQTAPNSYSAGANYQLSNGTGQGLKL